MIESENQISQARIESEGETVCARAFAWKEWKVNERIGSSPVLIKSNAYPPLIPSNVRNVVFAGKRQIVENISLYFSHILRDPLS